MGFVKKVQMKPGSLPSKFECQLRAKRKGTITNSSQYTEFKQQRLSVRQETSNSNTLHYTTTTADDAFQLLTGQCTSDE